MNLQATTAGNRLRWWAPGAIMVLAGVVAWVLLSEAGPIPVGAPCPPITAIVDGHAVRIAPDTKSPTLILLFTPECPHCERQLDLFEEHARDLAGFPIVFLSLGEQDDLGSRPRLRTLPLLVHGTLDRRLAREQFGRFVVPMLLCVDRKGIVKARMHGVTDLREITTVLGNI